MGKIFTVRPFCERGSTIFNKINRFESVGDDDRPANILYFKYRGRVSVMGDDESYLTEFPQRKRQFLLQLLLNLEEGPNSRKIY